MSLIKILRGICLITLEFPFDCLKHFFGVPNVRIVYKNGHVADFYFTEWSYKENGHFKWKTLGGPNPKVVNVDEIMTITQLY